MLSTYGVNPRSIKGVIFGAVVCVLIAAFLASRYSDGDASSILTDRGFDDIAKSTRLWLENRETFQEAAFAVEQELNGRDCSSEFKGRLLVSLKEIFLIFPVRIYGYCSDSRIIFALINERGRGHNINSWQIEYWIRPPDRIQCVEGVECTKLEPKWYLRSFVY
jgi:hypothetical protein